MKKTLSGRLVKNGGTVSLGFGPLALMVDSPLLSPDRKVSDACLQTQFHFRTSCVLLWNGKLQKIRGCQVFRVFLGRVAELLRLLLRMNRHVSPCWKDSQSFDMCHPLGYSPLLLQNCNALIVFLEGFMREIHPSLLLCVIVVEIHF